MTIPRADLSSFVSTLARADGPAPRPSTAEAPEVGGVDFGDRVREVLQDVNAHQVRAAEAAEAYANGDRDDIHGTMIALEQADITFRLVSNVRSRLVEAYREVMRMGA